MLPYRVRPPSPAEAPTEGPQVEVSLAELVDTSGVEQIQRPD